MTWMHNAYTLYTSYTQFGARLTGKVIERSIHILNTGNKHSINILKSISNWYDKLCKRLGYIDCKAHSSIENKSANRYLAKTVQHQ